MPHSISNTYSLADIAIYGAGGFGREVACLINKINESTPTWRFVGFFDDGQPIGSANEYGSIIGGINELNAYDRPLSIVIAIGTPDTICTVASKINNEHIDFPNIIAPDVNILDRNNITLGKGNIICSNCLISCNVHIGDFNIFNGYIPVGHDAKIGNYNVFMPSVNISGGVNIGNNNFMGVQSVVLQYITIGNHVRVAANSVIIRDAKDEFLYLGNPATKMQL